MPWEDLMHFQGQGTGRKGKECLKTYFKKQVSLYFALWREFHDFRAVGEERTEIQHKIQRKNDPKCI